MRCKIDDCDRDGRGGGRGWCKTHYMRWYTYGDVQPYRPIGAPKSIWERLYTKVTFTDSCWLWTGSRKNKYGGIGVGNKISLVHRVSYELNHGPIPDGLEVRHSCDTPLCVNPDHLSVGTRSNNMQDMIARGRAAWQKKEIS